MFKCTACGGTGCMIDPPGPYGAATCAKCGLRHGRFADLSAAAKPSPTSPEPDGPEAPELGPAESTGAADAGGMNAAGTRHVPLGESPARRLLRRAPVDSAPVPDYASLSSAKQALAYLHQSALAERRFAGTSSRLTCKWRLTDAGRRAASTL
jgi:hypothetical protein